MDRDAAKVLFEDVVGSLEQSKASLRCQEMADQLTRLGFEVRDGRKQGHKVFVHPGLRDFYSGAYTCGHGRNPEIKPAYVAKVARLLRRYETQLIQFMEGEK